MLSIYRLIAKNNVNISAINTSFIFYCIFSLFCETVASAIVAGANEQNEPNEPNEPMDVSYNTEANEICIRFFNNTGRPLHLDGYNRTVESKSFTFTSNTTLANLEQCIGEEILFPRGVQVDFYYQSRVLTDKTMTLVDHGVNISTGPPYISAHITPNDPDFRARPISLGFDIGVFSPPDNNLPDTFLMTQQPEPDNPDLITKLQKIATNLNAAPSGYVYKENIEKELSEAGLSVAVWEATLNTLSDFLDDLWGGKGDDTTQYDTTDKRIDLCAEISDPLIKKLAGIDAEQSGHQLIKLLHTVLWAQKAQDKASQPESKIVLRMVKGPTGSCIKFHVDQPETTQTLQVMLSDPSEYVGGRLCFFCKDSNKLKLLERSKGSACWHRRNVLHGVTSLTTGVRKSLFVINRSSKLKDSDITVTEEQVDRFLAKHRIH